jgi:D-lactate dehydrogenase (cytochrome)
LKELDSKKIRITISGNGTGLNGGRVPEGGIIISLEKLNKIQELNVEQKYIVVQPAVVLKDLQDFVELQNLFYPPDPTERNCFIGANVASNSSGARTFKYGPTRNYVIGLRILLPDGEIISIEREKYIAAGFTARLMTEKNKEISFRIPNYKMPMTKNASGYYSKENMDLIDLFIGSEGTLGIITEIKLRLLDLPKDVLSCVAFFQSEDDALNFIDEARKLSKADNINYIDSRAIEFFDFNALKFLQDDFPNIPINCKAAVWIEQDYNSNEDDILLAWQDLMGKNNCNENTVWLAINKKEQDKFHVFRHSIAVKVNEFISQRNLKKIGTDSAVPLKHFRPFYKWMKTLVEKENLNYVVYGHFGDCHPHLNILPENESEYAKAKKIYDEFSTKVIELNGTISAEHGIGKLKRDYLLKMYGEEAIKEMAELKLVFDPNKILNIGNIFEEKYLGTPKYA